MWRDRDRYPEHNLVPDTFWLVVASLLFAACLPSTDGVTSPAMVAGTLENDG